MKISKETEEARNRKALDLLEWGPVTVLVDDAVLVNGTFEAERGWVFNIDQVSDSENGVTRYAQIDIGAHRMDRTGAANVARQIGMAWNATFDLEDDLEPLIDHCQYIKIMAEHWAKQLVFEGKAYQDWFLYQ